MARDELLEWLGLIAVIVAWWPLALFGYWTLWYQIGVYVFSLAVVGWVLVRRVGRVRAGLRYSKELMEEQRQVPPGFPPGSGPVGPLGSREKKSRSGRKPKGDAGGS